MDPHPRTPAETTLSHWIAASRCLGRGYNRGVTERASGVSKGTITGILLMGLMAALSPFSLASTIGTATAATYAALVFAVTVFATTLFAWHRLITLDDDGVHVRPRLRRRLLPYEHIEQARRRTKTVEWEDRRGNKRYGTEGYLELTLRGGEVLDISAHDPARLAQRILARKHEAAIAKRQRPALLDRGDRSTHAWIGELRSRNQRGADYRSAPKDLASLWNIVESRWQRDDDRAAAAVALGHRASPEIRTRLLRLADEAESPRLRIAIERSLEEDDDQALAEALDALAAEDEASPWATRSR